MSALPDAQDTQFDEEKKQFASADVATGGSNSDVEKGSQHGTVANDTDLMAPPSGPPYGEPEKPNSRYSLAEIYKHKWAKVLVDVFCVAVILGWSVSFFQSPPPTKKREEHKADAVVFQVDCGTS